jgi:hypothetical protein
MYIKELGNICRNDYRMEWVLFIFIALGITICLLLLYSSPYGHESTHMSKLYGAYFPGYTPPYRGDKITTPSSNTSSRNTPSRNTPSSKRPSPASPPYDTSKLMKFDDYEYDMISLNEGERDVSPSTRKMLLSSYPMDWVNQPPSSTNFEKGLASFKEAFQNPSPIPNIYKNIDGSKMIPPDLDSQEAREREMLNTYSPKNPSSLTTYDAADAKELVDKIYAAKGKKASMTEIKPNVFSITSVNDLISPVEEEAQATHDANHASGENTIQVPEVTYSYKSADPFFTPGDRLRDDRIDYTQWTPGLERQFAPNKTMEHWY